MTKGILCLTDFSDSSEEALLWSINLAKKLNCHLTILYTYRLLRQSGEPLAIKRTMDEESLRRFSVIDNELLKGTGISYEFRTEIGFADDRIEEYLKRNKTSFVVIGKGLTIRNRETFDELVDSLTHPLVIVP